LKQKQHKEDIIIIILLKKINNSRERGCLTSSTHNEGLLPRVGALEQVLVVLTKHFLVWGKHSLVELGAAEVVRRMALGIGTAHRATVFSAAGTPLR